MRTEKKQPENQPLIETSDTEESGHETSKDSDNEVELTGSINNTDDLEEVCPITLEPPQNPVVADDGHTYDEEAITDWQAKKGTSPKTQAPISNNFKPNYAYKAQVETTKKVREKYKEKVKDEKKERKLEKERHRQEEADFRNEMRQYMAKQEEANNAMLAKMDDVLAHVKANKELIRQYQAVYHTSREQEAVDAGLKAIGWTSAGVGAVGIGALIGFAVAEAVEAGIGLGTLVTFGAVVGGTTAASGGAALPIWLIIIISAGIGIGIGAVVTYFVVKHNNLGQDERDYKRDQPLLNNLNRLADAHDLDQFLAATNDKWVLHGTGHGAYYVFTEILNKVSAKIIGWLQDGPMEQEPKQQAIAHLRELDSNLPVEQDIQQEPVYQRISHLKERNVLPRVEEVSGPHVLDNSAVKAINSAMHSGAPAEVAVKKSLTLHMATSVIDQAVKSVENGTARIEIAPIWRSVNVTEQGYKRQQAQIAALPTQ